MFLIFFTNWVLRTIFVFYSFLGLPNKFFSLKNRKLFLKTEKYRKKDMNKLGHACKQTCESWKYRKKRTYRLSTYLHELTLWEGTTLVIKENESLWDLKYGRLTEKKILKHGFQNFFNFKGKRDVDTIFCPASIHASKQRPEKKIKKKGKVKNHEFQSQKWNIYIYI